VDLLVDSCISQYFKGCETLVSFPLHTTLLNTLNVKALVRSGEMYSGHLISSTATMACGNTGGVL